MAPEAPWTEFVLSASGACSIIGVERIQSLWRGYGQILRLKLSGGNQSALILKAVNLPPNDNSLSHARKLRSYEVEISWYQHWGQRCDNSCRIPHSYGSQSQGNERWLLLEDLDTAGFGLRKSRHNNQHQTVTQGLRWLAAFHAEFMGESPTGLWETGTYWHLATRPDELAAMPKGRLKSAAAAIDRALSAARFQTFVHGDAKLANLCFSADHDPIAVVDFQYVGQGCGIKDVAYFLDSCLPEEVCASHEAELLDIYFTELKSALNKRAADLDTAALEAEWRGLYPLAWTDFQRFLLGWMPGQVQLHPYSQQMADKALASL